MKKYSLYILLVFSVIGFALSSCEDDKLYNPANIGEGEANLMAEISFDAFTAALSRSNESLDVTGGTPGDAISSIETLCVLLYDKQGVYCRHYYFSEADLEDKLTSSSDKPDDVNYNDSEHRAEETTQLAKVTLEKVPYGQYKIIAVANVGLSDLMVDSESFKTLEEVQKLELSWNGNNIASNNWMFGYFSTENKSISLEADQLPLITVNRSGLTIKSWIKRAVSKVTVAFDGRKLKDGVEIYIKSVAIKDIPQNCFLGANYPSEPDKTIEFASSEQVIKYGEGYAEGPFITNEQGHNMLGYGGFKNVASDEEAEVALKDLHSERTPGFFFFENLQGKGEKGTMTDKRQDVTGENTQVSFPDGVKEGEHAWKDAKQFGSYIEVKAFYVHKNTTTGEIGKEGSGEIVYRFMLGKDEIIDYNAERNYHYKLTLQFNGYANDIDWHIDYEKCILNVTELGTMNYQWQQFRQDPDIPNLGYTFEKTNFVTVESYKIVKGDQETPVPVVITYSECDDNGVYGEFGELPKWLKIDNDLSDPKETKTNVTFSTIPYEVNIDENLKNAKTPENTNLAANGSANCYIVSAPGTYTFPLVYGNALNAGGTTNLDAFECPSDLILTQDPTSKVDYDEMNKTAYLSKFKDYVNRDIDGPYIKADANYGIGKAEVIWQDSENLVTNPIVAGSNLSFTVSKSNIKQGNAVIAVYDNRSDAEGGPRVMWSWHIWVTSFVSLEETIAITNKSLEQYNKWNPLQSSEEVPGWVAENMMFDKTFDFMSMNLGWCSGGETIKYYPGKKFKLKFTAGTLSQEIEAELKSHIAFPAGNNPYYQWGRKDPFWGNKAWYNSAGDESTKPPTRMFLDSYNNPANTDLNDNTTAKFPDEKRMTTVQIYTEVGQNRLIQYPSLWHNPPRVQYAPDEERYISNNATYANLWGGTWDAWVQYANKTIYDPCPPGYFVSNFIPYTSFTANGKLVPDGTGTYPDYTYGVPVDKIAEGNPTLNLFEFYTSNTKLQSIIFPKSGYRDWDNGAKIEGNNYGYIWSNAAEMVHPNIPTKEIEGYTVEFLDQDVWKPGDWPGWPPVYGTDAAYNFEFSRTEKKVRPYNSFYNCDGMPVRPIKEFKML